MLSKKKLSLFLNNKKKKINKKYLNKNKNLKINFKS